MKTLQFESIFFYQLIVFQLMQINMSEKAALRKQRFASIRTSLSNLTVIHKTTLQVQQKMQKTRSRRQSAAFIDKQMATSRTWTNEDQDEQQKFHSLFKDKYTIGDKIGEGAHGVVRNCFLKTTQQRYAVKTFKLDREHILFLKKNFIDIKELKHQHILGYKALFFQMKTETCHLVMDYLPFPDLLRIQIKSEQFLKEIIYQILSTLDYIHQQKICHRDIKPQNILYDKNKNSIKIIDFGISKKLTDRGRKKEMLTLTGTPYYRAPQMFSGGGYDQKVDLWALGVTMYKLMSGVTPFESEYHSQTISNIIKGEFTFPSSCQSKYSKSCRNLVFRLLKKRSQRLTAKQAIKDMWFIDIHKRQEDQFAKSMSLNQNLLINSSTFEGNNNISVITTNNPKNKKKDKVKQQASKSIKSILHIDQQESMIYGYEQNQNNVFSIKQLSQEKYI